MKKSKLWKVICGILVVVFLVSCMSTLVACKKDKGDGNKTDGDNSETTPKTTLVVAYSNFSEKFSPFFASSAYDVDVYSMTQVSLLAADRGGNIIKNGIEGEVVPYNGTNYTYKGLSNLVITKNADGSVYYDITMRDGVKFSDGTALTVKDAIFSMYVLSDFDYDGSSTFYSLPIKGMNEWRTNLSTEVYTKWKSVADAILDSYDDEIIQYEEDGVTPIYSTTKKAQRDADGKVVRDTDGNVQYDVTIDEDKNGNPIYVYGADYVYDAASTAYTKDQFDALTGTLDSKDGVWGELVKDIVSYCVAKYSSDLGDYGNNEIALGMGLWGFGDYPSTYGQKADGTLGKVGNNYTTLYVRTTDEKAAAFADGELNLYRKATKDDTTGFYTRGKAIESKVYNVAEYTGDRYAVTGSEDYFEDFNGNQYDLKTTFPTAEDYVNCLKEAYGGDYFEAASVEAGNGDIDSYIGTVVEKWIADSGKAEMNGQNITSISGITYNEEARTIRVTTTEFAATTVYQLAIAVAPMAYYGDAAKWNPAAGSYGFTRGDLTAVRSKTTKPMGAGPYKFVSYKDGIVTFEANDLYWEGAPKIKNIMFKEYSKDEDKTPAVVSGEVDIATPSINNDVVSLIKQTNNSESLAVDASLKIATDLVDYNGYGYLGINSERILVGTDKASTASKNLRKAFMTLFAAYREYTVNSYYAERASVIQYPISNCSWAAPQPADAGYAVAFSKTVDGAEIYTSGMTEQQRWDAAKAAAIGYFKAAGYTWDGSKFTAAPDGAKMSYEAIIGGGGTGDHPTMALLNKAKAELATIGIELVISDQSSSSTLFAKMEEGTADIFVAAWGGAADPDMYQVYNSENKTGSNHYRIADATLDEKIDLARKSDDRVYRKATYKQCLDIVLDWAVELPVYQRKDCTIYSTSAVKISTLTPDTTPYWSYLAEIYKVELN